MDFNAIADRAGELSAEMTELGAIENLTDADEARFVEIDAELAVLAEKREKLEKRAAAEVRASELAEVPENVVHTMTRKAPLAVQSDPYDLSDVRAFGPGVRDEYRGRALEAIEKTDKWEMDDSAREQVTTLIERNDDSDSTIAKLVLGTGSRDYKTAWAKQITGQGHLLTGEERGALERAMSLTTTAGGFAVPAPIDPTLIVTGEGSSNPFRQISRVEKITNDNWLGLSAGQMSASWDAEAAEVSDDTATFAQPTVPVYKAAAFVPYSIEIGQDYPNIALDIAALMADGKDQLEATAHAVGTGSAQPTGIVVAKTASTLTSASTDVLAVADIYVTAQTLGARYQANASWVANRAVLNDIRRFGTAVAFSYSGDLSDRLLDQILGKPAYESSAMDGSHGSGDNYVLVYGDFSKFVIADRIGASIEAIPHLFHTSTNRPSGSRGSYMHWRTGSDSIDDAAFELLNVT